MLFDLQGKRRRLVQATYLTLAILMGGGLVLFGIGGDVTGGLLSEGGVFSDGGGDVDEEQEERLADAERALRANPQDVQALASVVQLRFNRASEQADEQTGLYNARGRSELFAAADAWQRYLASKPAQPSPEVAGLMTDIYGQVGDYKKAQRTAQIVVDREPSVDAYLDLALYATFAKDKRTAEKAGDKAIELAADDERRDVKQQVKEVLKQKPPPLAPGQAPPDGGGGNVFQEPGEEGQPGGGQPPGGGGQPPSGGR